MKRGDKNPIHPNIPFSEKNHLPVFSQAAALNIFQIPQEKKHQLKK